ncbi:hypothetical protein Rcae01_00071 [Novipirellula caenicola]|uniref:Uncharacterized protein n=1 Tax=Novipirellula caenicola TaxID=1536901 RepID=A0ABP9VHD7_9BACT
MNAKLAPSFLLTLLVLMHGCAHAEEPPSVNDAWGPVAHRVDEQGFRWTERRSPTLGLIARTATRHKTRSDPNSEREIIVNGISTDEEFPRHIYNDWVYPNGTRQREFPPLPPYKCYSIVSAKQVEYFSVEDRKTRKWLAVFVFDAQQRLILDPIQNDLSAYDSARLYGGFSPKKKAKPGG